MKWWQRRGLRFKLALAISLTMFLILGVAFLGISGYFRAQLWQYEVHAAKNLSAMVYVSLDDAMMIGLKNQIQEALVKLGQSVGGQLDGIAIYDDQAELTFFASGFPGGRTIQRESMEIDVKSPTCSDCHQLPPEERPTIAIVSLEGQEVLRNVLPLYNRPRCQTCHGTGKGVLGISTVDLRLDHYRRTSTTATIWLVGGMALAIVLVSLALYLLLRRIILSPLGELMMATQAVTQGELDRRVQVRSSDEVGQVARAFNTMTSAVQEREAELERAYGEVEREVAERERLQQEIIEAQRRAIQELSTPVIPVMDTPQGGIVVVPLIGSIDTARARDITRRLLVGISEHQARGVILDITGVPVVDSSVANYLNKTIQAARLKGARVVVTGISDAVAETIVDLGIDWSGIETVSDLQAGLVVVLNKLDIKLVM